jgi:hypothetical protein
MIIVLYLSLLWNLCVVCYIYADDLLISGSAIRNTLFGSENVYKLSKLELCQEKKRLLNDLASIEIENSENEEGVLQLYFTKCH